jgi:hypothetical protein
MRGTGWLWLARVLNVAGAAFFVPFVWTFFSETLFWLFYFFMSLTAFFAAATIKKRGVAPPEAELAGRGAKVLDDAGGHATAMPPRPMFDREGRTPLERVFNEDEEADEDAGRRVGR